MTSLRNTVRAGIVVSAAIAAVAVGSARSSQPPDAAARAPDWPAVTSETRPWTRWWWMGSAVDPAGLTSELESLREAGIGGVEITPIYGAAGSEPRFVTYLSADWMQLLDHTLREAGRLGLGVDMATGTGWPFGGPLVSERESPRTLVHRTWTVNGGQRLAEAVRAEQAPMVRAVGTTVHEVVETAADRTARAPGAQPAARPGARRIDISDVREPVEANPNLQALALEQVRFRKSLPLMALVARSTAGATVDLTSRVGSDGTLDWTAPPGSWTLHGLFLGWHGKLVERAAPGGEGNVIDHFSRTAIRRYLERFDRAFAGRRTAGLRAFFNDSYEVDDAVGQADGTPALFEEFRRRRGYDLRDHLAALFGSETSDTAVRVIADYRETISDLLLDTFTREWRAWARRQGAIVRNQAHGSPANILDLYAASDVPETEGSEIMRFKWATSAAHVAGRRLVSAEAATWLGEHFRVTLAEVRAAVDRFFLAGVNHVVYHGTAYSPASQAWPGWQFYASVEFNPRNSWWTDFRALNEYVTRVQSFLQSGRPDHDVLLYYPFYDSIAERDGALLEHYGVANPAPEGTAFESAATTLQQQGYTFDFISDRQLHQVRVEDRDPRILAGDGSYRTLVLPSSRYIPLDTFERVLSLVRRGATVVALRDLPADVSGLADLDRRRARFHRLRDQLRFEPADRAGVKVARLGRGTLLAGDDLAALLGHARVEREPLADLGIGFTRRRYEGGRYYFLSNSSDRDVDGWVPLRDPREAAVLFDAMSGERRIPRVRRAAANLLEVELELTRSSSIIIATTDAAGGAPVALFDRSGPPVEIAGPWTIRFEAGGPGLPGPRTVERLASWTALGGGDVQSFSGTASYTATFERPVGTGPFGLDLGQLHESARVELNGRALGTLIGPAYRLTLDASQLADRNTLTVRISNLMANRIAALDRAGVVWRSFYNVNFPARLPQNRGPDGLFSAAAWEPLPSGLLGPVTIVPLAARP